MSYWIILIPLIFFLMMFYMNYRKTKKINLYNLLLLWYSFSLLANILSGLYYNYQFDLGSIIYYTIMVYIFIFPFIFLKTNKINYIPKPRHKDFVIISWIIIVVSLISILSSIIDITNIITLSDINSLRNEKISEQNKMGFFETIISFSNALYFIPITLFFIGMIYKLNKILLRFLLISSFSIIIFHLSQLGRTGMIFWAFFFLINFIFFRKYIVFEKQVISIKKIYFSTLLIIIAIFLGITYNRFSATSDVVLGINNDEISANPFSSILDYFGHSIIRFDMFYRSDFSNYHYGAYLFPLVDRFLSFFGIIPNHLITMYSSIQSELPLNWYFFATFLRELWYDFGLIGTIFIALIFNFIVIHLCKKLERRTKIKTILILFFLYSVPFLGLFSLPISTMKANFTLLFILSLPRRF